ncbi:glycosyltransferase family 4 protein [Thermopolyspora sp. NPDC052614]|uniref:glycosyltransferase family 4 protein n=1 Tax=Thermopolyspora sp. NPDC052614 TaxID=3155682 RepID=UPI003422BDD4
MKIRYFLLHAYGMGGTIRTVFNQANAMAAAGHDVEILSAVRRRTKPQFPLDERIRLRAVVDQRSGYGPDTLVRRIRRKIRGRVVPSDEFAARYFTERVERGVIDAVSELDGGVLVTTRPALNIIAARYAPRDVVHVAQEHMNLGTHKPDTKRQILRHYSRCDAVVVLTETDRRDYAEVLPGTRIERIPNSTVISGREPCDPDSKLVIAAGRLYYQKGFDLLIPAFAQVVAVHPDWRLRIFGTGPKQERLQAQIDELGLSEHVRLMGRSDTFDQELRASSVYALSSRFEGLPMVMIEAMAHCLPVVSFDCPTGPGDVITDGEDGLLVPAEDVNALAQTLIRVIDDPELRKRLGLAARETVRSYAPEVVMPQWEALFSSLLAAHGGKSIRR